MPYNDIDFVISDADLALILDHFSQAKALIPQLVNLTPREKKTFLIGAKTPIFLQRILSAGQQRPELVPGWVDLNKMKRDYEATQKMEQILNALNQLREAVDDTRFALQQEAVNAGIIIYDNITHAAKNNVPGIDVIHEQIKSLMPRTGKKKFK